MNIVSMLAKTADNSSQASVNSSTKTTQIQNKFSDFTTELEEKYLACETRQITRGTVFQ